MVLAAGLVDPRTQPGVAGQLGGAGEPGDVTDLGGDGVAGHPADPRGGHQQWDVPMVGAHLPEHALALGDLVIELVDQMKRRSGVIGPRLGQRQPGDEFPTPVPNRSDTGRG